MDDELDLESLDDRLLYSRLSAFYKIDDKKVLQYLVGYLPTENLASISLRKRLTIYPLDDTAERYGNSFFL